MISYVVESMSTTDALVKFHVYFSIMSARVKLTAVKDGNEVIELGEICTDDNTYQYYDKRNNLVIAVVKCNDDDNSIKLLTEQRHAENYEFLFGNRGVKFNVNKEAA